ncbi:MAG: hypothetical protein CM1200mP29_05870 [Verrucomicrobiota bacterium]|nr:MAG: hypothetical protein CM1200mP29_05870 [Verrucomicrobiota bacterium]
MMSNPTALIVLQFLFPPKAARKNLDYPPDNPIPAFNVIGNLCRLTRCPNPAKGMIQCGNHCHSKGTTATQTRTSRHIRLREKQYGLILGTNLRMKPWRKSSLPQAELKLNQQ